MLLVYKLEALQQGEQQGKNKETDAEKYIVDSAFLPSDLGPMLALRLLNPEGDTENGTQRSPKIDGHRLNHTMAMTSRPLCIKFSLVSLLKQAI